MATMSNSNAFAELRWVLTIIRYVVTTPVLTSTGHSKVEEENILCCDEQLKKRPSLSVS